MPFACVVKTKSVENVWRLCRHTKDTWNVCERAGAHTFSKSEIKICCFFKIIKSVRSFFSSFHRFDLVSVFLDIDCFRTFVSVYISRPHVCLCLPDGRNSSRILPWIFSVYTHILIWEKKTTSTINVCSYESVYFRNLCVISSIFRRLQHFPFPIQHQEESKKTTEFHCFGAGASERCVLSSISKSTTNTLNYS